MDVLSFLSWLLLYKYAALTAVVYSSAIILPLPTNAILLAVGAFSGYGYFNFWLALVIAVAANTAGDLTDYLLTRRFGERVTRVLRLHRFRFYNELQEEFRADAAATVFTTRFAGSLSPIASLLAGLVGVPFSTFFWWDLLGNCIEPGAALALGYAFGAYWSDLSGPMEIIAAIVAAGVVLFVLLRIRRRLLRRRRGIIEAGSR